MHSLRLLARLSRVFLGPVRKVFYPFMFAFSALRLFLAIFCFLIHFVHIFVLVRFVRLHSFCFPAFSHICCICVHLYISVARLFSCFPDFLSIILCFASCASPSLLVFVLFPFIFVDSSDVVYHFRLCYTSCPSFSDFVCICFHPLGLHCSSFLMFPTFS